MSLRKQSQKTLKFLSQIPIHQQQTRHDRSNIAVTTRFGGRAVGLKGVTRDKGISHAHLLRVLRDTLSDTH